MKRAIAIVLVAACAVVAVAAGGESDGPPTFTVELDNAFGLTVGSDMKVAGVRAGTLADIRLDPENNNALVDIEVTKTGFGELRTDAFCESRPQSLIGEYYLDCVPGTDPSKLADGERIPIEQTGSTVPADLLNSVMQRPFRERLRIILAQLGVGLAARGDELNEAVRRFSPALRETDRVLAILAEQNTVLRDLVENADIVLNDLSGNRTDVVRWVREAGATAADSAERQADIAAGLDRLPAFVRELRPTMADLGRVADAQTPSLLDLDASADRLERLFVQLAPFSRATQVNLESLGDTSVIGQDAVRSAAPVVDELNRFSVDTPELANNLDIVLDDLDDRGRAIEKDPRSPGGEGYTGFEALLQYTYDQTMAINIFDANTHILKANLFESECSEYQNAETIAEHIAADDGLLERCRAWLGPNQLGVIQPDPTLPDASRAARTGRARVRAGNDGDGGTAPTTPTDPGTPVTVPEAPAPTPSADQPLVPLVDDALDAIVPQVDANPEDLLDFLLSP